MLRKLNGMNAINYKTLSVSEEGLYIDVSHYLNRSGSKKRERVRHLDGLCNCLCFFLPLDPHFGRLNAAPLEEEDSISLLGEGIREGKGDRARSN
jgi:hypothetical protein